MIKIPKTWEAHEKVFIKKRFLLYQRFSVTQSDERRLNAETERTFDLRFKRLFVINRESPFSLVYVCAYDGETA